MTSFQIEWRGKDELKTALARAMAESPDKVNKVVKNQTEKLRITAWEYAPKPGGSRYGPNPYAEGPLHDNITARHEFLAGEVHAEMFYSGFVNFGTRKMRAQPFMTDAFHYILPYLNKEIIDVAKGLFK